jgi:hypothetical protein
MTWRAHGTACALLAILAVSSQACDPPPASAPPSRSFPIGDRLSISLPATTEVHHGVFSLDPGTRTPRIIAAVGSTPSGDGPDGAPMKVLNQRVSEQDGGSGGPEWQLTLSLEGCQQRLTIECSVQREYGQPAWGWCLDAVRSLRCERRGRAQ